MGYRRRELGIYDVLRTGVTDMVVDYRNLSVITQIEARCIARKNPGPGAVPGRLPPPLSVAQQEFSAPLGTDGVHQHRACCVARSRPQQSIRDPPTGFIVLKNVKSMWTLCPAASMSGHQAVDATSVVGDQFDGVAAAHRNRQVVGQNG